MTSPAFTKTETLAKLLALGPLTLREAVAITGWRGRSTEVAMTNLQLAGRVEFKRVLGLKCRAHEYRLTNTARVPARAFAEGA